METRETITLDAQTQHRLFVITQVLDGRLDTASASRLLGLSVRQVRRLVAALRSEGAAGLVHGNRGRRPVHRTPEWLRATLVELATTTYAGVNRAHLADLLLEREGIAIPERSLRRILDEAGIAPARRRRSARHRSRRERVAQAGRLLQLDGSRHRWLGRSGPELTLVGAIDDATGIVTAGRFGAHEDAAGYFAILAQTVHAHGVPVEVYSDRHGIFVVEGRRPPTIEEQLEGLTPRTQVGRACAMPGSAGSAPTVRRPRAGSNGCGAPSRTASSASSALPARRRSRRRTPSLRHTCRATTSASPSMPRTPRSPGGPGRASGRSNRSSASSIRAGSPMMRPSAGSVGASPCPAASTAAGQAGRSSWKSASTAASGSATATSASRSRSLRTGQSSCGPAR